MTNFLRALGIVLSLLMMIGFGLCGMFSVGSVIANGNGFDDYGVLVLGCGIAGLVIAVVAAVVLRGLIRRARAARSGDQGE